MPTLPRDQEADRLLLIYEQQPARIMELLERQMTILHHRAQVLLGLCGIIVTVTGFSGRLIAGTNRAAQIFIIAGVAITTLAAIVTVYGVLHLRWLSRQEGDLLRPWLLTCLAYRDRKTRWYRLGLTILTLGVALYVVAVAIMLLNPQENVPSMVR